MPASDVANRPEVSIVVSTAPSVGMYVLLRAAPFYYLQVDAVIKYFEGSRGAINKAVLKTIVLNHGQRSKGIHQGPVVQGGAHDQRQHAPDPDNIRSSSS